MITARLVQSRRHLYELRHESEVIAQIAFRGGLRASVITADRQFDMEAIEGIRKRVVKFAERDSTIARGSSLGRYAVDLERTTLYWHSLPGPPGSYCWMTGDGLIAIRYVPAADGFLVQAEEDMVAAADREQVLIVGSYLLARTWIEVGGFTMPQWAASLAFARRTR